MSVELAIERWRELRGDFELYREAQHAAASDACNGVLLNARGLAAGIDSYSLFMGPRARAMAYASEELAEWWTYHGRLTFAQYERENCP